MDEATTTTTVEMSGPFLSMKEYLVFIDMIEQCNDVNLLSGLTQSFNKSISNEAIKRIVFLAQNRPKKTWYQRIFG